MLGEAKAFNRALVATGRIDLRLASVEAMPFTAAAFDRAVMVNTFYFVAELERALGELHRVLRPEGVLVLAGITPEAAASLPIIQHGFRIYDEPRLAEMVRAAGFRSTDVRAYRETTQRLDGGQHERSYHLFRAVA